MADRMRVTSFMGRYRGDADEYNRARAASPRLSRPHDRLPGAAARPARRAQPPSGFKNSSRTPRPPDTDLADSSGSAVGGGRHAHEDPRRALGPDGGLDGH